MSLTPIDSGASAATLERRARAAYKRRRETMAAYHDAQAAFWRRPNAETQEAVDHADREKRRALAASTKARDEADQAHAIAEARAA